jgi:hypothetical protein
MTQAITEPNDVAGLTTLAVVLEPDALQGLRALAEITGNEQLCEWMHLLLLPVVVGTAPLWLRHREYVSRTRQRVLLIAAVAFTVFVAAGYLVPLNWTGDLRPDGGGVADGGCEGGGQAVG